MNCFDFHQLLNQPNIITDACISNKKKMHHLTLFIKNYNHDIDLQIIINDINNIDCFAMIHFADWVHWHVYPYFFCRLGAALLPKAHTGKTKGILLYCQENSHTRHRWPTRPELNPASVI